MGAFFHDSHTFFLFYLQSKCNTVFLTIILDTLSYKTIEQFRFSATSIAIATA